ncbi:MAG: phosphotransferase [Desulfurococcales archaeon]|nr:phosphotransferase [Desulfurococcales archaeon]
MPRHPQRLWEKLDKDDIIVLRAVEQLSPRYEFAPVEVIERKARLPPPRILRSLDKLNQLKLVRRNMGSIVGYSLTFYGLNVLAFDALYRRRVIDTLGDRIGVGKEGEVYIGLTPNGEKVIVKFHREGRSSFQRIRRLRSFVMNVDRKQWHRIAKMLGEREFKIMVVLEREGAMIPKPISWNRNAVVQQYIPGVELYRIKELDEETANQVLEDILRTIEIAYNKVGIVHGDLSEYNVLVSEDGRGYVIDWPQYVYKEEPNAMELLRRDIEYITSFFRRRFGVRIDPTAFFNKLAGAS